MKILKGLIEAKNTKAKGDVKLPKTKLKISGFGKDSNGNSVIRLKGVNSGKGFSIQTNGNCKEAHRAITSGLTPDEISKETLGKIATEVKNYIDDVGTANQKKLMKEG